MRGRIIVLSRNVAQIDGRREIIYLEDDVGGQGREGAG